MNTILHNRRYLLTEYKEEDIEAAELFSQISGLTFDNDYWGGETVIAIKNDNLDYCYYPCYQLENSTPITLSELRELARGFDIDTYEEARAYLIREGLDPDEIGRKGLEFIKGIKKKMKDNLDKNYHEETKNLSCALCGYFCNNPHHSNNWFDTTKPQVN